MNYNHIVGTVIFDFDSTLIQVESMESILFDKLNGDLEKIAKVAEITELGMSGKIDFFTALSKRLAIMSPTKRDIVNFTSHNCPKLISYGFPDLIKVLKKNRIDIWILSGGFEEAIIPFSDYLGIEREKVHAVKLNWYQDGYFKSINNDNGFAYSKVTGANKIKYKWKEPVVIVGDGYTDYSLYQEGLANDFIAYTEHAHRDDVVAKAPSLASSCQDLSLKLKNILKL